MPNTSTQKTTKPEFNLDESRLELYALLAEGYLAMKQGEGSTLEEVKKRIAQRRKESE